MFYFEVIEALHNNKIPFLIVGGLAVNLHGIPRVTNDLDIIVSPNPDHILVMCNTFEQMGYIPRIPVNPTDLAKPDIVKDWIENRNMKAFSFYHSLHNYKVIDIVLVLPFDFEKVYENRVEFVIQDIKIPVASIEDIIAMKQASGRPVDESDIAMLREAQRIIENENE
jgi:hypothetical protein